MTTMLTEEIIAANITLALVSYNTGRIDLIPIQPATEEYLDSQRLKERGHRVMPIHWHDSRWGAEELCESSGDAIARTVYRAVDEILGTFEQRRRLNLQLRYGGHVYAITEEQASALRERIQAAKQPEIERKQRLAEWSANPQLIPVGKGIQRKGSDEFARLQHTAENEWIVTHSARQEESYDEDPMSFTCSCPFSGQQHSHKEGKFESVEEAAAAYRRV